MLFCLTLFVLYAYFDVFSTCKAVCCCISFLCAVCRVPCITDKHASAPLRLCVHVFRVPCDLYRVPCTTDRHAAVPLRHLVIYAVCCVPYAVCRVPCAACRVPCAVYNMKASS